MDEWMTWQKHNTPDKRKVQCQCSYVHREWHGVRFQIDLIVHTFNRDAFFCALSFQLIAFILFILVLWAFHFTLPYYIVSINCCNLLRGTQTALSYKAKWNKRRTQRKRHNSLLSNEHYHQIIEYSNTESWFKKLL